MKTVYRLCVDFMVEDGKAMVTDTSLWNDETIDGEDGTDIDMLLVSSEEMQEVLDAVQQRVAVL